MKEMWVCMMVGPMVALMCSCWMVRGTSPIEAVRRVIEPESCSTRLSARNTLLLMLLVATFINVKLSHSNRQHVPLERSPCSRRISSSGDKGYMTDTLDREAAVGEGAAEPNGCET